MAVPRSKERPLSTTALPAYRVFDDFRYSQRTAVVVRWFLILTWLFLHNYRPNVNSTFYLLNGMVLSLAVLNAYVSWRIWNERPITKRYVVALSAADLGFITLGIAVTSGFDNTFFVLYYPAMLGFALAFPDRWFPWFATSLVAAAYAGVSIFTDPGVDVDASEEKILIVRIASMYAVIAAGALMSGLERMRRREAVRAEQARANENLELQRRAQEAAQEERSRIARDIHDGIGQSIYALSLNLETCVELAGEGDEALKDRLRMLVPLAKKTLLESRHYIGGLKPILAGETDLTAMAENHASEFEMVAGVGVDLEFEGEPSEVSEATATAAYRILQEALSNVLKHAGASRVLVRFEYDSDEVRMRVSDDGVGFDVDGDHQGNGLGNMRQRAEEIGGRFGIHGAPGPGTTVDIALPYKGGNRDDVASDPETKGSSRVS